ncbi:MAG TPA: hypothetical protein VGN00_14235 [Puia sp.]|jgi:hypothetical protein
MIKASELRIGNLIEGKRGEVLTVSGSMIDLLSRKDGDPRGTVDERVEPIPLTEEWLERIGFIKGTAMTDRKVFYSSGSHSVIHSVNLSGSVMIHRAGDKMVLDSHIEYVHQLQNLYFALTGEELTIKETA